MTKEELKKYTIDFMNNETGSNRSNINSFMGRMLIKYSEVFQKQIVELKEKYNRLNELKDFTFETYKGYGEIDVKELVRLFESRGYRLDSAYQENIELQEQLTKAKDIMKRWVNLSNSSRSLLGDTWFDTLREAEDFLKESEVEK